MQDYRLTSFDKGDFKDNYNNYWCDATFEGISEPVKVVTPDPLKWEVGQVYYGEIQDATTKNGKPYLRFKRGNKEGNTSGFQKGGKYDSAGQKHGNALKIAADYLLGHGKFDNATQFVEQLQRLAHAIYLIPVPTDVVTVAKQEVKQATNIDEAVVQAVGDNLEDEPLDMSMIPF